MLKKISAVLLVLVLFGFTAEAPTQTKAFNFEKMQASNVVLILPDGFCSGVIVGEKTVITSLHCFVRDTYVLEHCAIKDGNRVLKASLFKINGSNDLALVKIDESLFPIEKIAKIATEDVKMFDKVAIIGTTGGSLVMDTGKVVALTSPERIGSGGMPYMISISIWYGMSGGGIYNENTELVGIGTALLGRLALSPHLPAIKYLLQ